MSKYSKASVRAVELLINHDNYSPREAWDIATTEVFGFNSWGQKKGCPRNAFLGLCEEGLVRGVDAGSYTTSIKNKKYALRALDTLKENSELLEDPKKLWNLVIEGGRQVS